jgi:hypothetical protein
MKESNIETLNRMSEKIKNKKKKRKKKKRSLSPQPPLHHSDSHIFFLIFSLSKPPYGHLRIFFFLEKPQISKQNYLRDLEPTEK